MKHRIAFITVLAFIMIVAAGSTQAVWARPGSVYSMTNDPDGNKIVVFRRDAKGFLTLVETVDTEGLGSGGGLDALGSQGSLIMTQNRRWLIGVNAGSNEISVFRMTPHGLILTDIMESGGEFPVSLTVYHNLLYVLNNDTPNIAGYTLSHRGHLMPILDSRRILDGAAFSQVEFDNQGKHLVITDRSNHQILVFNIGSDGRPEQEPVISPSQGQAPFGFLFNSTGKLVVSEAGSGAVSTYHIWSDGTLLPISTSVMNQQEATCWIAANRQGFIFTANTASNTLSSYEIYPGSGDLKLIQGEAGAGDLPLDMDMTGNGRFLYVLNAGGGNIGMFKTTPKGNLINLGVMAAYPFPIYAQGMVAQ